MKAQETIRFTYLYRDAGNSKAWGEIVFSNPETLSSIDLNIRLRRAFDMGCLFVADQIQIPEVFLYTNGEVIAEDHCFHEFHSIELSNDKPTDENGRSIKSFVEQVEKESQQGWHAFNPIDRPLDKKRSI